MVALCQNRPESFGPHSAIHPHLPTTCFLDTIVIPLATWIYLLTCPLLILSILRRRKTSSPPTTRYGKTDGPVDPLRPSSSSLLQKILMGVYYFLILAMLAMVSLEIARLDIAHLGIGLLPFTYAGVIVAGVVHFLTSKSMLVPRGLGALYWIMLAVTMALKVAALVEEEGAHNRVGVADKYPLGDEVTDLGVMLGVEIVLAVLEIVV